MNFDQWKQEVIKLARTIKKSHLVPNDNFLFTLWELGWTPLEVIAKYLHSKVTT